MAPLTALLGPGGAALLVMVIALNRYFNTRGDKTEADIAAQRAALSAEMRAELDRKEALIERLLVRADAAQSRFRELEDDRDDGWDRLRGMEQLVHAQRHRAHDLIMAAYAAGKAGLPMPTEGLPGVPMLHEVQGRKAE